ncbi:coniferyl aldehyde dehydrogenase [Psychrobacter cryohalolentis]|uniref:Aldehyde dehydrogenase n=1 Tax=Psychrobacter cryohalolentis (strain ATCC BAA-1226 / DSM 17306 / VKM B-2378 / K5) TaxID=335284 RepID=Q1QBT7_PSYCK|nr:coniferyl aldehyde dehydrogenase [Psychrobacter cryohalolentis]ABE74866.1 aldehyde dehydrogenase [Psychrobacter cryohalolentis K5]ASE25078.1 coniferyl aldehyde dehydrogenase [Psychrobacter cryohalolentis]
MTDSDQNNQVQAMHPKYDEHEGLSIIKTVADMQSQFSRMQNLSRTQPINDWATRRDQLDNLELMLSDNQQLLANAISADFGYRSESETQFAELFPSFTGISHAKKHGKRWMKAQRVSISALYMPAHNEILPQPLGVVGIMVPWNYPLFLAIGPMIDAITAGNRIMVKMSEAAPQFAQTFAETISRYFSADMVCVVIGEVEIAAAFSELPFDHLLYTGSTAVGKKVMAAAAPNLTPVTLELGGKSPVIVLEGANLENAVNRVMMGKTLNAGQTCIAPDYVLIQRQHHDEFVHLAREWMEKHYPNIESNPDYSRIINVQQFKRVKGYLENLSSEGVYRLTDATSNLETRLMPPVIVSEPAPESDLMQNEIFAPVLPLMHYDTLDNAIAFINARPRPLALYVFGDNSRDIDKVRTNTVSGGLCINEVIMHVAQHDLPFGGVGDSGTGAYHGKAGFDRLSHMKPIFVQSKLNGLNILLPPYGGLFKKAMALFLK